MLDLLLLVSCSNPLKATQWHVSSLILPHCPPRLPSQLEAYISNVTLQVDHSRRTVSSFWWRDMETGSRAKKARSGCPKKTTLRANIMLKCVVRKHRFQSLGAVNRMWNERISKVISLSTARSRIRRQSLQSRVARRKPLIGLNNRYATKYDRTKPLVGMCSYTFVNHAHDTLS